MNRISLDMRGRKAFRPEKLPHALEVHLSIVRDEDEPFTLLLIGQGEDGDLFARPERACHGLFQRGQGYHLAAYLGEPLQSP